MKLMIDIPKEEYELVQHGNKSYRTELELMNAVANGTLLPEHHGRLIDADKLVDSILADRQSFYTQSEMINVVNYAPTIIEETRRST